MKPQLPTDLYQQVQRALQEDVGTGDLTAALIPIEQQAQATVICRENAVICGIPWFNAVFKQLNPAINIDWLVVEGQQINENQPLCHLQGQARALLTGERCGLNFLQTLSATATVTRHYVDLVADTGVVLLDTRKTIPLLRLAQKYAVVCGGGHNHRIGLFDAFLIKENHIIAAHSIQQAVKQARQIDSKAAVEVEVETLAELKQALAVKVESVLLDNFSLADLRTAVALNQAHSNKTKLEASGNVDNQSLPLIAKTGVDYISIGALTKHIQAIDLSMRFTNVG